MLVAIAHWDAMGIVHIPSKLTVLFMGIFLIYHVNMFNQTTLNFILIILNYIYLIVSLGLGLVIKGLSNLHEVFGTNLITKMKIFIFVSQLPAAFVLPSREALCLGDRVAIYLPRCADTNSEVRKVSAQVCF